MYQKRSLLALNCNIFYLFFQVTELKSELKLRGLPVSGTKTDLIERLKPFQDVATPSTIPATATTTTTSISMEVTPTTAPPIVLPVQKVALESVSSTSPVSPTPADPAFLQLDVSMCESQAEMQKGCVGSAGPRSSPQPSFKVPEEKDRRLHEKERQIEELMRKLEQEQRLVEELKMQLEVEKRGQVGCAADSTASVSSISTIPAVHNSNEVKMEGAVLSNCLSNTTAIPNSLSTPLPTVVKLEDVAVSSGKPHHLQSQTQLITQLQPRAKPQVVTNPQLCLQPQKSPQIQAQPAASGLQQFFISHRGGVSQVLGQPQTLLTGQTGTQILFPVSLPNNTTAIQLPSTTVNLQV